MTPGDIWDEPGTSAEYYATFRHVIIDPKHPQHDRACREFRAMCAQEAGPGVVGAGGVVYGAAAPIVQGVILKKP